MAHLFLAIALFSFSHGENIWPSKCHSNLRVMKAIEYVETRGHLGLVGSAGELGTMQVLPKYSKYPKQVLKLRYVGRAEGCRIFGRFLRRARGICSRKKCNAIHRAVMGYNAGNAGLRAESLSGRNYFLKVKRRMRRRSK